MSGISLRDVSFRYATGAPVLAGLTLEAPAGSTLGLLGDNGAGKTTTFRLLAGLLRPDGGEIEIAGVAVAAEPERVRRLSAYVPDEPLLYPSLSALENLNLFGLLWGVPSERIRERAERLLREVGLWDVRHQWVKGYSRGMRQKLSICAGLLHEPRVVLMDEPFNGLDVSASLWARRLLRDFVEGGGCVVFTSHTPELVESFADRIAILHRGTIAFAGDREAVRREGGIVAVYQRVHGARGRSSC